jgi:hypothetical protein
MDSFNKANKEKEKLIFSFISDHGGFRAKLIMIYKLVNQLLSITNELKMFR